MIDDMKNTEPAKLTGAARRIKVPRQAMCHQNGAPLAIQRPNNKKPRSFIDI